MTPADDNEEPQGTPAGDGTGTILVVDDRPENRTALRAVLDPLGHTVVEASSGEEALRRLLQTEFSVILLDVQMPGLDGFETAKHIKQRERTADVPIIFLTAYDRDAADAIRAFSTGAVDFVTKPFDPVLLRAKVQVFLDLSAKTRMLKRQSALLAQRLDEHYAAEARNLRKLADAALVINSTRSLDEMLDVITQSAREVIGAHEAETLLTMEGDETRMISARSYSSKYDAWAEEGREVDLSAIHNLVWDAAGPVRMTKRQIASGFESRGVYNVAPGHPMLEGWLAVPVIGRTGRVVGLIQVADKEEGEFGDSDDVVLLQLAQLAAVAIENAEQYQQEHDIAETLQRSLLPEALPNVAGLELAARYQPGTAGAQVGGDWYDVIEMEDGSVLLAVGDVVGRGPRAAALMGQLRTAMRAYAIQGLAPTELMTSLDRLLQGQSRTAMATAVCLKLSRDRTTLEVVSAGHPPPLLACGEDGKCTYLSFDPNPPLGVMATPSYDSSTVTLDAGALLLLYTDGLVEERDASLDDGLRRLAAVVDAENSSLDDLCRDVLTAMVPGEKNDDIAMLAARVTR